MLNDKCTDFTSAGFKKGDIINVKAPKDTKILWGSAGMIATTGKSGKYIITEVNESSIIIEKKRGWLIRLYQTIKKLWCFVAFFLCALLAVILDKIK